MEKALEVTCYDGEPFRFFVKSEQTHELYTVDLQSHDWTGECTCIHWGVRLGPRIAAGGRGPLMRCKHIRSAREWFLEHVLPKLAKAMKMEETDVNAVKWRKTGFDSEYAELRDRFLRKHRQCAVYPRIQSVEVHHTRGRLGRLLTDTRYWLPVSREGHHWIDSNREAARKRFWKGLPWLCAVGEWNKQTP